jgi:hypothetical protein
MELLVFVLVLIILDVLAVRYGADSRPGPARDRPGPGPRPTD